MSEPSAEAVAAWMQAFIAFTDPTKTAAAALIIDQALKPSGTRNAMRWWLGCESARVLGGYWSVSIR